MALMNCPECQCQVSDKAAACPHCGFPFSDRKPEELYLVKLTGDFGVDVGEDTKAINALKSASNSRCKLESADLISTLDSFPKEQALAVQQRLESMGYRSMLVSVDPSVNRNTYERDPRPHCPNCGSASVQLVSGFSFGKAAAGTILFGSGGAVAGLAGKPRRMCVSCGYRF